MTRIAADPPTRGWPGGGRNAFAQGLHQLSGNTGDAAELIARLAEGRDLSEDRRHLSEKAGFLRDTHQTHRFYPVLRYFHYREPFYALPRVLLIALDTATLLRSVHETASAARSSRRSFAARRNASPS